MTINDLAKKSGYSVATVSRVLNDSPNVSAKDKAEINRLVEMYDFQINVNARPFTALFAIADVMGIGAMRALHDNGMRVPKDVSVMGFDGWRWVLIWCRSFPQ